MPDVRHSNIAGMMFEMIFCLILGSFLFLKTFLKGYEKGFFVQYIVCPVLILKYFLKRPAIVRWPT